MREKVEAELRRAFKPEFLNRIDDIVFFKPLLLEEIKQINELILGMLRERLADRRITLKGGELAFEVGTGEPARTL